MRNFLWIALVALLSCDADAASWYVDNTASGSNNGTSWANAWQHFNSITWANVNPGDTVYISGGTTSQTYGGYLNPSVSGTSSQPITITCGIGAGKNGTIIFDGADGVDSFSYIDLRRQYITLDGQSAGDGRAHFAPVNLWRLDDRTLASKIMADSSVGIVVKFCAFTNVNNCVSLVSASYFRVANCTGIDIRGDAAVRAPSCFPDQWDANFVENCNFGLSYSTNGHGYLGPDGIQGSHGLTVRNNLIWINKVGYDTSTQHPDMTQIIGNHIKIYGNEFLNIGDSANDFDWWNNPHPHDIWIFNNVYRITFPADPFPEFIRFYGSSTGVGYTDLTNFKVWNNTFIDNSTFAAILIGWNSRAGAANPTFSGVEFKNNIFVNCGAFSVATGNPNFNNSSFSLSRNTFSSVCTMSWNGTSYNASSFNAIEADRTVGTPDFVSYSANNPANDFHLRASDLIARGNGVDLSPYFSNDKDGNARTVWDIGAYEYSAIGTPPNTPSITSPADGALSVGLAPTLIGTAYSDPNGIAQADAQFRVTSWDGGTVIWDSATSGPLGAVFLASVPGATLDYSTNYKCSCRYKSSLGLWSNWSTAIGFTTIAAPATGPGAGAWNILTLEADTMNVKQ